jgi:hypothetical protein
MSTADARYDDHDVLTDQDAPGQDVMPDQDVVTDQDVDTDQDVVPDQDAVPDQDVVPSQAVATDQDVVPDQDGTTDLAAESGDEPVLLADEEIAVTPVQGDNPADADSKTDEVIDSGSGVDADSDWHELQGRFVDDPAAAVREAGNRVEKALAELRSRVEAGSTEDLRTAFRRYRDLHASLS